MIPEFVRAGGGEQQQPAVRSQDADSFGDRFRRAFRTEEHIVQDCGVELVVPQRQPVHIALAQGAVRQSCQQYLGPREAPRVGINIHADRVARTRSQQLQNPAVPAADVDQVADRSRDREFDKSTMQRAVSRAAVVDFVDAGAAQAPESFQVFCEARIIGRNKRQQFAPQGCLAPSSRQPVVNEMAVAKTFEQARIAQLLQVLGDTRLAQSEYTREFRDTALTLCAKRDDAQPGRVGQGF